MINILVAENAKMLSNIISNELEKNNCNCKQVYSLKDIKKAVSIEKYDYIILSLYLVDAEEKKLIKSVRKITTSKIIVLTSKNNDELREYLFKYGIIDYLNKENIEQIIKNIKKLIKQIEENSKRNILIIEDSNVIRKQEAELLSRRNYNIFESETGKNGIKIFNEQNIDLVILDLELNDMNGLDVLEQLKIKNIYTPVLMVSGTGNANSVSKCLKNGASDFIRKPIIFEEFVLKTDMIIDYYSKSKELQDYKNNLEKKVDEVVKETKDLNIELIKQKKDLIIANDAKDIFLANVSHELKTPLNSINLISSIMKKNSDNNLNEKQIKNLKLINSCGKNLQCLINDILDISMLDGGEVQLFNEKFDLNYSLKHLYETIVPQAEDNNINFEFSFDKNIKYIFSDEKRIMQIIKNFLSNSLKFTKNGNICLSSKESPDSIKISVKDDGIGIEKNKIEGIFDRFKQVDGAIARKYGGAGLGLSISYSLSQLLEGNIEVTSKITSGSTFTLVLPKKITHIAKMDIIKPVKKDDMKTFEKEKILILSSEMLEMMHFVIKLKDNFEVKQVLNLEQFDNEKIDEYKHIVINEFLIDTEKIKDLDSILLSKDFSKYEEKYLNSYKKKLDKPIKIDELIQYLE